MRIDDDVVATYEELVDVIVDRLTDDDTRADWAGPVTGIGHDQRVHPAAALVAAAAAADLSART